MDRDIEMDKPRTFTPDKLWVPEFIADPYPTYESLRGQSPLRVVSLPAGAVAGMNEPLRSWALMKYDDVYNALRDHDTFSSETALVGKLTPRLTVQRLPRRTTREVEVSGVRIPEGAAVSVFYGAANRDPEAFPAPDEFRLDRDLRHHVGFGSGIHYCLGAPLARAEANVTLNTLLDRFSSLTRGAAPAVRQTAAVSFYGFHQLPLVLGA